MADMYEKFKVSADPDAPFGMIGVLKDRLTRQEMQRLIWWVVKKGRERGAEIVEERSGRRAAR